MKYEVSTTRTYRRALKKLKRSGCFEESVLNEVVILLARDIPLEHKHKDHALAGDWAGHRECHIQPDLLLVYRKEDDVLVLVLVDLGSHSDIFGR